MGALGTNELEANATPIMYFIQANKYMLQNINRNTIKRCEICSKLIIKTRERRQ